MASLDSSVPSPAQATARPLNGTVWNAFRHEKAKPAVAAIYPAGGHETLARFLRNDASLDVRTALHADPDPGLTDEVHDAVRTAPASRRPTPDLWAGCSHPNTRPDRSF